jgi:hypothetical protein
MTTLKNRISKLDRIHARTVEFATFPFEDTKVIVQGTLRDHRYIKVFDAAGAIKEPGIVHHIEARLLVRSGPLTIEAAEAEMLVVPLAECRQTITNIEHSQERYGR